MSDNLTPEQVKKIKTVSDYREAVKSDTDYIGLMGHQPSLKKIRFAYQNSEINDTELEIVLNALYDKTGGEAEPFKSAKHFYHEYFVTKKKHVPVKEKLSAHEQAEAAKAILGDDAKKVKKPKKQNKKPAITIDPSLLPDDLKGYL